MTLASVLIQPPRTPAKRKPVRPNSLGSKSLKLLHQTRAAMPHAAFRARLLTESLRRPSLCSHRRWQLYSLCHHPEESASANLQRLQFLLLQAAEKSVTAILATSWPILSRAAEHTQRFSPSICGRVFGHLLSAAKDSIL